MSEFELALEVDEGKAGPKWSEWAALYESSERTLKRWAAHGKEKGDECPLGNPRLLAEWWARTMDHRVPAKILAAAARMESVGGSAPFSPSIADAAPAGETPPSPTEPPMPMREFVSADDDQVGIGATMKRMQDLEVFTFQIYQDALKAGKDAQSKIAFRNYTDISSEVVRLHEKVQGHLVKTRELIPRVEAEACFSEIHTDLLLRFRGTGEPVFRRFGIPVTAENLAVWAEMVDELCVALQQEVFADES